MDNTPEAPKIDTQKDVPKKLIDPFIPLKQLKFEDEYRFVNGELRRLEKIMDFYDPPIYDPPIKESMTQSIPPQNMGIAEKFIQTLNSISRNTQPDNMNSSPPSAAMPVQAVPEGLRINTSMQLQRVVHNERSVSEIYTAPDKEHITPIITREKLKQSAYLFVCDHNLYAFNGHCYEILSDENALVFIATHCKSDIMKVGNARHANSVLDSIMIDPDIILPKDQLNHYTISFENGCLDIKTFAFFQNSPQNFSDFYLKCSYVNYTSFHTCPHFVSFLDQLTGGDKILTQRIWEMIGYCLTPDIEGKVIFVLQGVPNSGKSLLIRFLTMLFPENHVTSMDIHELDRNFAPSELINKYICIFPDMPSNVLGSKPISKLKQFSGNDRVSADVKYKNRAKFTSHAKLICATNHPFKISEQDEALDERLVAIPFNYSIPKEKQDPHLIHQLWDERDAIVSIALAYYRQLVVNHYKFSGYYPINTIVSKIVTGNSLDMQADVFAFLEEYYCYYKDICIPGNEAEDERNNKNRSFVEDMYRLFSSIYYTINKNTFSSLCVKYFDGNPLIIKTKHRRYSHENAISCFDGLVLKKN